MDINEMHYDFKTKLNKVDSQQYKNLRIPEIDWALNEAQELFVKMVAKPRLRTSLGFETHQRAIDDIRPLVVNARTYTVTNDIGILPNNAAGQTLSAATYGLSKTYQPGEVLTTTDLQALETYNSNNLDKQIFLESYWHFISADVTMNKGTCPDSKSARVFIRQHDDDFENSPFDRSSFEWRTVNGTFTEDGIKFYTDGSFTISDYSISYIKKLRYIHNAAKFVGGTYKLPSGIVLNGAANCELPDHTHREIVDIAVLLVTGELQIPDYEIKLNKVNNNLKQ